MSLDVSEKKILVDSCRQDTGYIIIIHRLIFAVLMCIRQLIYCSVLHLYFINIK